MNNLTRVPNVIWRYLDSLDSTRYSPFEWIEPWSSDKKPERVRYAALEVCAAILMGNAVVVTTNQMVDSYGFLRKASEIIRVANEKRRSNIDLPIWYAHYNYANEFSGRVNTPYEVAAHLFRKHPKIKEEDKNLSYFELSSWRTLDQDTERRKEWAKALEEIEKGERGGIPPDLIRSEEDQQLAEDLIRILNFFTLNSDHIRPAKVITGVREEMVRYIANLLEKDLDGGLTFANDRAAPNWDALRRIILQIRDIYRKFEQKKIDGRPLIDNRSLIRQELKDLSNEEYFGGVESRERRDLRTAVLKTVDSIYNFSNYKATGVRQDKQTEPQEKSDYDRVAFRLGQWTRDRYYASQGGRDSLSSTVTARIDPTKIDQNIDEEFWRSFFALQQEERWQIQKEAYIGAFVELDRAKSQGVSDAEMDTLTAAYQEARERLIEIVNDFLPSDYQLVKQSKATLIHKNSQGEVDGQIEVEDFAEDLELTLQEKGARYALAPAGQNAVKGRIADYE